MLTCTMITKFLATRICSFKFPLVLSKKHGSLATMCMFILEILFHYSGVYSFTVSSFHIFQYPM